MIQKIRLRQIQMLNEKDGCEALLRFQYDFYQNYLAFCCGLCFYVLLCLEVNGGGSLLPCARLPLGRLGVGR